MARIKGKDLYLKDDDQIYFGTGQDAELWFDGSELRLNHTISGVDPTQDYHLTTKQYVVSSGVINHDHLYGLGDDDHPQYILTNGLRGFTSTVSGVAPIEGSDLTTRDYVIGLLDGSIQIPTESGVVRDSLIQFSYAIDLDESSTNSTSFVQKLRLTVSGIPTGDYRIGWAFSWRQSKANADFVSRIQVDDTTSIFDFTSSPYVDTGYWNPVSSFYYYGSLLSGTHNIDLDYHSSTTAATSYIKDAKLEFWRIQ